MSVAQTIKTQIGRNTLMFIGAHDFVSDDNSLIFHVGRGLRNKIIVTLEPSDTYKIERCTITRNLDIVRTTVATDIYCEQLSEIIADMG